MLFLMKHYNMLLKRFLFLFLVFETLDMSVMTLSNRNNNFHRFVTAYFEQGFACLSLAELFHDLQPNERIGHLETMMKAVYFQNNDAIQKPTFFIQCTQASILKERSFHSREVEQRVLNFFQEERCFCDEEYPFIEQMVQSLHERSDINILEFMGYKKTKKERVPVLLGVCVFGMTKTSGCCIFYLAGMYVENIIVVILTGF